MTGGKIKKNFKTKHENSKVHIYERNRNRVFYKTNFPTDDVLSRREKDKTHYAKVKHRRLHFRVMLQLINLFLNK